MAPAFPDDSVAMAPLYAAVVHGCHAGRQQEALRGVLFPRVHRGAEEFNMFELGAYGAELGMLAAFFDPPWTRCVPGLTATDEPFVLNEAGLALRALGRLDEATEVMRLGVAMDVAAQRWSNAAVASANLSTVSRKPRYCKRGGNLRNTSCTQCKASVTASSSLGSVASKTCSCGRARVSNW